MERWRSAIGPAKVLHPAGFVQPDSNPYRRAMPTEVAPGIHRLGNEVVNFYLVEDDGRLTLVDAGVPGFREQLETFLRGRGRTLSDIDAVVLTHGHMDHVGVAEVVRQAGATVHIHEADLAMARDGKEQKPEANLVPYFRHLQAWKLLALFVRSGALRRPKIAELSTFADGDALDVPGHPRVIHTPGHSDGHVVFHLPDRGALFAGDAVCTWNPLTGRPGPQIMPRAFAGSAAGEMASLDRLEPLAAGVVLPGHGNPWVDGVPALVARVREAGPS
jgi:glyoxylase-like metal-dependent hydrolase (beta-lactamase superfamily II)